MKVSGKASHPNNFTPGETAVPTEEGWMGLRACLNMLLKRNISNPYRISTPLLRSSKS
jgi:hypothetical protein